MTNADHPHNGEPPAVQAGDTIEVRAVRPAADHHARLGAECPPECFPDDDGDRHQYCPQDEAVAKLHHARLAAGTEEG